MKSLIKIIFIIFLALPFASFADETSKPLSGRVLGNADAKIIIEEYASMSCGHCASFHNNDLKSIKKEYIDKGAAKLIFYDFPLDRGAMIGSMITQCMNDDQFYPVLDRLFQKQAEWTRADDIMKSISEILQPLGLEKATILSCLEETTENQERWKSLLAGRKYAIDIKGVEATPTFFVNGKKFEGKFNLKNLKKILK
ncbi:MAG: disulfide bond formation protein DsbA [Pelagibacterales bacterium]|jgi:protein-disulfide isomerase|nr:disulfide bond formation protein DsbA [Pelagibacterales bacterium]|tara:strand:- start:479 stop:1072 length:594 start_codon:yes stop_codon:yes gene_type:complete